MKRIGIRLRVMLAMMAVLGGLLVLTHGVMDALIDRFLDAEISDSLRRGRTAYDAFTVARNDVSLGQARSFAQVPHVRAVLGTPDVDEEAVRFTIAALGDALGDALLFVTDAHGAWLADTRRVCTRASDLADNEGVEQALRGEEFCGLLSYGGESYLVALCPVTLDHTVLGLLGIGYPLEKHIRELRDVTGLDVMVMRADAVVASTWIADGTELDTRDLAALSSSGQTADASSHVVVGGRELLVTSIDLRPGATRLLLSRPLDEVLVHFQRAKAELLVLGLAIAVLGLLVSRWVSNRIARPIRELTSAANELARGDLAAGVRVTTTDEIGVLGGAFNAMARQLAASMREIASKADAAERANQAKARFLATMSHELRTPLNSILGFNAQLLDADLAAEQRDFAQTVQRSGQDLLALIDDVLDFAKVDADRLRVEREEFDLHACLRRAVAATRPAIEGKGLAFEWAIDEAVPHRVRGSERRLRQIVVNYLSNAAKFTASGRVALRASTAEQSEADVTLRVEVRDTGIGIAREDFRRLFQPFAQLDDGSRREYGGAGLGLALCKDLAELMHGSVGVESERGFGSTFWFTAKLERIALGASLGSAAQPGPEPAPALPRSRAEQRILVVEDNVLNRRVVGVVLTKSGWDHAFAENGQQALDLAREQRFDLVLMDCQMPVMDGFEATRRLRTSEGRTPSDVPILALTANALEGDREACANAGMDGFVTKPFHAPDLIALIESYMEGRFASHASNGRSL